MNSNSASNGNNTGKGYAAGCNRGASRLLKTPCAPSGVIPVTKAIMKHIRLVPTALLLGACQSTGPALEPGESATLVFTSDRIAVQPMVCRPGQGFVPTKRALAATPLDPAAGLDPEKVKDDEGRLAVPLPAGSEVVVGVTFAPNGSGADACRVSARFTPDAGGLYRAEFVRAGDHCGLALTDDRHHAVGHTIQDEWHCPDTSD